MDVLSDVLRECRVEGSVFCRFALGTEWAVAYPPGAIAAFHVVTQGACVLEVTAAPDGGPVPRTRHALAEGDLVVLPHGHAHVLRDGALDAPAVRAAPIEALVRMDDPDGTYGAAIRLGAGPAIAGYVCGAFRFGDPRASALLEALPAVIHLRAGALPAPATDAAGPLGPWLSTFLTAATCEAASNRPGASLVLARLSDVLFVHAVRAYLAEATRGGEDGANGEAAATAVGGAGWLAGLRDRSVGRALALLHEAPERTWTIAALAREVGMSRSRFAARFTQLVGRPPLDYLTEWRMQRARSLLRGGTASVGEVAGRLGYRSEAAFSHAFRRRLGVAPGAWRRAQVARGAA